MVMVPIMCPVMTTVMKGATEIGEGVERTLTVGNATTIYGYREASVPSGPFGDVEPKTLYGETLLNLTGNTSGNSVILMLGADNANKVQLPYVDAVIVSWPEGGTSCRLDWASGAEDYQAASAGCVSYLQAQNGNTVPYTTERRGVPVNLTLPTISGLPNVGETLTISPGSWIGYPSPGLTWEWKNSINAVVGSGPTYVVQGSDIGETLRITEKGSNIEGSAEVDSFNTIGPITE